MLYLYSMKYFIRSVKYFIYLLVILALVVAILVKMKMVDGNLGTMFVNGYDSLWQIAGIAALFAALYPKLSFSRRSLSAPGEDSQIRPVIMETMDNRGYRLASEDADGTLKFVKRSPLARMTSMWEDTLTFTRELGGYSIEGLTKHSVRVISALDAKLNPAEE